MSGARRRWTFGSWPSIIAVFTVLTVVFLAVWLINQSSAGAPRPEGNSDFLPVVPDFNDPTPTPRGSDAEGSMAPSSPSPSPSSKSPTPPPPPEEPEPEPLRADYGSTTQFWTVTSTIVVHNPSDEDAEGWTVVVVLPEGMTVDSATDADYEVNGSKVTFTPDGNEVVPAGGSVQFVFTGPEPEDGEPRLESCKVNGERC